MFIAAINKQRINQRFVSLIATLLGNDKSHVSVAIVIGGVNCEKYPVQLDVWEEALRYDHVYYITDDLKDWLPIPGAVDNVTILSQFQGDKRADGFFPLSVMDAPASYEACEPTRKYNGVYWGHFQKDRIEDYIRDIDFKGLLIVGDTEEWRKFINGRWPNNDVTYVPYTRDREELLGYLSTANTAYITGAPGHDGVNVPLRIFEAASAGCRLHISNKLIDKPIALNYTVDEKIELLKQYMPLIYDETKNLGRGDIYGNYEKSLATRGLIMDELQELHMTKNGSPLPSWLSQGLSDVVLKLCRVAVNPDHHDSFVDMAGYAKLVRDINKDRLDG